MNGQLDSGSDLGTSYLALRVGVVHDWKSVLHRMPDIVTTKITEVVEEFGLKRLESWFFNCLCQTTSKNLVSPEQDRTIRCSM